MTASDLIRTKMRRAMPARTVPPQSVSALAAALATRAPMRIRNRIRPRGLPLLLCGLALLAASSGGAWAAEMKVAVVNMQRAINTSEAGERSKKILIASKTQKENELKGKETAFRKLVDDTRSNMMLSDAAKAQKEKELRDKEGELRQEVQNAQRDLQEQERKLTDSIFAELRTVIGLIAQEKKYDIVLEQAASQVILFSNFKLDDITDEVVERYNKIQSKKP